jgi:hypothetical protein
MPIAEASQNKPKTNRKIVIGGLYGYEIEVTTIWIPANAPSRSRDLGGGVRHIPLSLPRLKCLEKNDD